MAIFNIILTKHPLYFARFIPLAALLLFTACGGKDDYASKPVTIAPSERAVASPNSNEPPIIILSPSEKDINNVPANYSPTNRTKKKTSFKNTTNKVQTGQGNYAVQIGAFSSSKQANHAATQARQQASTLLSSTKTNIDTIPKNGQSLYRVKLKGLSASAATQACSTLKQKQLSCIVTQ